MQVLITDQGVLVNEGNSYPHPDPKERDRLMTILENLGVAVTSVEFDSLCG